ncbi:hypothetical protein QPK24_12270 [Paenibacillus polygoni]|uniref:N-acetyltransferase domain-containing protein n=1 Tax=Paenibacillus polygoni TaxID=3050112 RepID=A0ABY8X1W1_9BACL|nr:hypothetical protein [Paenibacillus polygoni]WIV17230.1 hypothetical protein QPK24_12270 [Paenibacillus polygoni]
MNNSNVVRQLSENDNFDLLLSLINQTANRYNPDPKFLGIGMTVSELKDSYFSSGTNKEGYVVEKEGKVIAVMGVSLSEVTSNGYIEFGVAEGHEEVLRGLTDKCSSIVNQKGGKKLFRFASSKFGQIRNREITLWEQLGFNSEEFSDIIISLDLRDWNVPDDFHNENIYPATDMELSDIRQILIDDEEELIAELVSKQFVTKSPDQIVLTMMDKETKELVGIAYYRVIIANEGSNNEFFDASGFGIHFRPRYQLDKSEKERLLHASLLSMKQLGIYHVYSRITLKNFEIFSMLIREGFDDPGIDQNCTVLLFKTV